LAYGINNPGQIVGIAKVAGTAGTNFTGWDAFLYSNGRMQAIGGAQSAFFVPSAVNDHGWIVGTISSTPTYFFPPDSSALDLPADGNAVTYINGRLITLGTVPGFLGSQGKFINNSGSIVGNLLREVTIYAGTPYAETYVGVTGGFIYFGGTMHNLNDYVDGGWNIVSVGHINDAGQIAATGTMAGSTVTYALLLTPSLGLRAAP
jgi:probable HAF family extracellular repeat protein